MTFEKSDFAMCLHTALRKCCDSHATSVAYHIIEGMDNEEWSAFTDIVFENWEKGASIKGTCLNTGLFSSTWKFKPLTMALLCVFKLFDTTDWTGFVYYTTVQEEADV